jgi:hypothetical protein
MYTQAQQKPKKKHLPRQKREKIIFDSIMHCADVYGVFKFTIPQVAKHADCSTSLVKLYFGGIVSIQHKVIQYARDTKINKILDTPITDFIDS